MYKAYRSKLLVVSPTFSTLWRTKKIDINMNHPCLLSLLGCISVERISLSLSTFARRAKYQFVPLSEPNFPSSILFFLAVHHSPPHLRTWFSFNLCSSYHKYISFFFFLIPDLALSRTCLSFNSLFSHSKMS